MACAVVEDEMRMMVGDEYVLIENGERVQQSKEDKVEVENMD